MFDERIERPARRLPETSSTSGFQTVPGWGITAPIRALFPREKSFRYYHEAEADLNRADQLHFPLSAVGTTTPDGECGCGRHRIAIAPANRVHQRMTIPS